MKSKPKALYVHIPFCNSICGYCDFCRMIYNEKLADKYLISLKREIDSYNIEEVNTIYVGGGTPTSLTCAQLETLLTILDKYYHDGVEYTFESNVETLTSDKLRLMKSHNVNRLSLGVQSTDDQILKYIGRKHTFLDVCEKYKLARLAGFDNISFDLILGLPGSSLKQTEKDIDNIIALNPEHISTYSLTVLPKSIFGNKNIKEMPQDVVREMYDMVHNKLSKAGYVHYEVSNFGKPGYESKHNYVYWNDDKYYGIGLGASGYIDDKRYVNTRNLTEYIEKGITIASSEIVNKKDNLIYYLMLKLRTINGIKLVDFKYIFNTELLLKCPKTIDKYVKTGLLILDSDYLRPTYNGMMVLDMIVLDLLNEFESSSKTK